MVVVALPDSEQPPSVRGQAIDLRENAIGPETVRTAIADPSAVDRVTIHAAPPGAVWKRLGVLRAGKSYPIRAALAASARALGYTAPQDDQLRQLRSEVAAIDPAATSITAQRRQVATIDDPQALVERVEALRGRVQARRANGEDPGQLLDELRRAAAELADRTTALTAAREELTNARKELRAARDHMEDRLALNDRIANLEREARQHLATAIEPQFRRALSSVPGSCQLGDAPWRISGDHVTAALAIARLAPIRAPVVLTVDRFESPLVAAGTLATPVVLV